MADSANAHGQDALEEKLDRLSKKPGVKATIVLDRSTGSILKTSGHIDALQMSSSRNVSTTTSLSSETMVAEESESRGIEQLAAMIWTYVNCSETLVQELDTEDEVRLLRLRTKKQELVVVPDAKYLLVVVHDTPSV